MIDVLNWIDSHPGASFVIFLALVFLIEEVGNAVRRR